MFTTSQCPPKMMGQE